MNVKHAWYKVAKSRLRKPLNRMRHWGLDEYDVFIGSYPRSGNTWLRFMLFDALARGMRSGFNEVNHAVPNVGLHLRALPLLAGGGRLLKTHEPYQKEYRKAIYLIRDVRDVVLSEFAYQTGMGWIREDFERFLGRFLRGGVSPFTRWDQHVGGWLDSPIANTPDLLVVNFENMRKNTEATLVRVFEFLAVPIEVAAIKATIAENDLHRMREKEAQQPQLASDRPSEIRFVGSGRIGNWKRRLTSDQVRRIEEHTGELLRRLGYSVGEECEAAV